MTDTHTHTHGGTLDHTSVTQDLQAPQISIYFDLDPEKKQGEQGVIDQGKITGTRYYQTRSTKAGQDRVTFRGVQPLWTRHSYSLLQPIT